ncbi:hypothetical protein [Rummeliibacillus pycnus]|uniref:hypothetical protein n=1 Tax=Rummeliibacillus pycnus TaxID=101070 RepID=UPI0037CB205B
MNKKMYTIIASVVLIVILFTIGFYIKMKPPTIDKNEEMTSVLKSSDLASYIDKISYNISEKPDEDKKYAVDVIVKVNDDFDKMNLYERYNIFKSSLEEFNTEKDLPDCNDDSKCEFGDFIVQSPASKHTTANPFLHIGIDSYIVDGKEYFSNELFDKFASKQEKKDLEKDIEKDTDNTTVDNKQNYYYTKEQLEADPYAPSKDPADYNENGEFVPKDGPSDNPADYNSDGEYDPVSDMTQEEIKAELEDMLRSKGIGK